VPIKTLSARNILSSLVVALILFFLIRVLYKNWLQVSSFDFAFTWSSLAVSFLMLFGFFFLRVYIWRVMLGNMGVSIKFLRCIKISFLGSMGKYLPGKVWMVLGKVYLSGQEGIAKPTALASVVLEVVLELTASIVFFLLFLSTSTKQQVLSENLIYILSLVMVAGLLFLHPRLFYTITNWVLRRMKQETINASIGYRGMLHLFALYCVLVLVQGVAFYFFVNAICYVSPRAIFGLSASVAIAGAVGTLSVFTPSGLGVREGVLALLLANYVVTPVAVLLSLLARLWITLGELICALFASRI